MFVALREHHLDRIAEVAPRQKLQSDCQEDARADEQRQHHRAPDEIVDRSQERRYIHENSSPHIILFKKKQRCRRPSAADHQSNAALQFILCAIDSFVNSVRTCIHKKAPSQRELSAKLTEGVSQAGRMRCTIVIYTGIEKIFSHGTIVSFLSAFRPSTSATISTGNTSTSTRSLHSRRQPSPSGNDLTPSFRMASQRRSASSRTRSSSPAPRLFANASRYA